jgi:integrase
MTKPHSTLRAKPAKPHPDYPLFPHGSGQWARKIRGKLFYFGSWKDPDSALAYYLEVKDDLIAGRRPRHGGSGELTVENLCNLFLVSKKRLVETGDREPRTLEDYKTDAKRVVAEFGSTTLVEQLTPEDFAEFRAKLGRGVNAKTLEGRIGRVQAIFNYANKNGYLERSLTKIWGTEFAKPSRKVLKIVRRENPKSLTAAEIWGLLEVAGAQTAAMIWLGINGGFGNKDVSRIKISDLDFENGWLRLYRSKTGIDRRCPLWPETIKALKAAIKARPAPKSPEDSELVFITKYGKSWSTSSLSSEISKLREEAGITGRGKGFYALRHMFQTIGEQTKHFVAVEAMMGRSDESVAAHYREFISDESFLEVSNHVRDWLLAGKPSKKGGKK